jgi:hypothetical protein
MITPIRYRETQLSFYFLIPIKKGYYTNNEATTMYHNEKPFRVLTYQGEPTKTQKENVVDAWAWFEKADPYLFRKMQEGAITITLSHEHPLLYWGGIEGND